MVLTVDAALNEGFNVPGQYYREVSSSLGASNPLVCIM